MRNLRSQGMSGYDIAESFGLCDSHVSAIVSGKKWKSAGGPIAKEHGNAKLAREQVIQIHERARNGATCPELARDYGVDPETIRDALKGRTWRSIYEMFARGLNGGEPRK